MRYFRSDLDELIVRRAETDGLTVLDGGAPVGVRVRGGKVVVRMVMRVRDDAVGVHGLGVDLVGAGGVERHGIERREHAHVRHDRHVAVVVAVAARRHVERERDVERRPAVDDGLGILGDLAVEQLVCDRIVRVDGVHRADVDAAAAAGALVLQDGALAVFDVRAAVRAVFDALAAADALVLIDDGLAGAVHLLLAGARAAAHADVLERAAEARGHMTLGVRERDEDVGIHDGAADLRRAQILAAADGHEVVVLALDTVGNDAVRAGAHGRIAVEHGAVKVVERIGAAADIERVAVGEKRLAAERAHIVAHDARPVRAQIGHVARLTEVELDGDVLVLEIDLLKAGGFHEPAQLFERADLVRAQIGKIYFCRFHGKHLRSLISFSFPAGTSRLFYSTVLTGHCQPQKAPDARRHPALCSRRAVSAPETAGRGHGDMQFLRADGKYGK